MTKDEFIGGVEAGHLTTEFVLDVGGVPIFVELAVRIKDVNNRLNYLEELSLADIGRAIIDRVDPNG